MCILDDVELEAEAEAKETEETGSTKALPFSGSTPAPHFTRSGCPFRAPPLVAPSQLFRDLSYSRLHAL